MKTLKAFSFALLFLFAANVYSQVSASFTADSTQILIGDFLHLKFAAKFPNATAVQLPIFKDSIGALDIIAASKKDTAKIGEETVITQQFTVSAYDSGLYTIPPQAILFTQNGMADSTFTNEIAITVNTVPVDTTKNFKPIKAPLEVKRSWREYLLYVLIALGVIVIALLAWWLFKKYYKKKDAAKEAINRKKTAHEWALKELQKLEQEKVWQQNPKTYYSRLTDIFRRYLEYRFSVSAMESTTDEIDLMLTRDDISGEAKKELVSLLKLADLVKFAKQQPLPEQNKNALNTTREFVKTTAWKEEIANNQSPNNEAKK
ncbi:MAG: hypothetical protein M9931_01085 [Chitinophagales bacterium]|nr:hypothetical protein [Chitinophagales bacterium]